MIVRDASASETIAIIAAFSEKRFAKERIASGEVGRGLGTRGGHALSAIMDGRCYITPLTTVS